MKLKTRVCGKFDIRLLVLIFFCCQASSATAFDDVKGQRQWQESGWKLMEQFCLDCHNADYQEAELDLSRFGTLEGVMLEGNGMTAERVLNMIRFGAMPPEDADLPSDDERKQLAEALDSAIYAVTCDLRPTPGVVTARRLNRAEYNNSVRDLFGMDLKPAENFPSDEVGGGFDNNSDVLSLSTMLVEKYLDAAEEVASRVIVDPETLPNIKSEAAGDRLVVQGDSATGSFYGRFLAPETFVWGEFDIPVAGTYEVDVGAGMSAEDVEKGVFGLFNSDGKLIAGFSSGYYRGGGGSNYFETELLLTKGMHRLFVAPLPKTNESQLAELTAEEFTLDSIAELSKEQLEAGSKRIGQSLVIDRNFDKVRLPYMVRKIRISGPVKYDDNLLPHSQEALVREQPRKTKDGYRGVDSAAAECLRPLMRRAFRGPVSDDEVDKYVGLVVASTERGESYHRGLQIAVSAILVSPRFLFRVETPEEAPNKQHEDESYAVVRLTANQLASRLSYFLWSSIPDEELLELADSGELLEGDVLLRQVRRMIQDPKAESLATEFADQWLGLRNLEGFKPDESRFAGFEAGLIPSMIEETRALFLHIARNNRPVGEFLTADYTFVNRSLADYYELDGEHGNAFQKVSLGGSQRRGILTHASILTLTSQPTRTSPVKRGKWILENILGTPPPEPPPGVPELEETKTAEANATLREQMELHRLDPSCAACHRVMDNLGFGLENFDAVGRYRTLEEGREIDASGELPGRREFAGAAQLTQILADSESKAFAKTFAQRLLSFALGRELTPQDRCFIDEIFDENDDSGNYRFVNLVETLVTSRPFQYYEWKHAN